MAISSLSFGQLASWDGPASISANLVSANVDGIPLKTGFTYTIAYSLTTGGDAEGNARVGIHTGTGLVAKLVETTETPKNIDQPPRDFGFDLPDIAANTTLTGSFKFYVETVNEANPFNFFFYQADGLTVNSLTITEEATNITEIDYDFEAAEVQLGTGSNAVYNIGNGFNQLYGYWSRNSNTGFYLDVVAESGNNVLYLGNDGASHPFSFVAGNTFVISADVTKAVNNPTVVNVVINGLGLTDVTGVDANGSDDATVVGDTGNNTISFSLPVGGNRVATIAIPASATNVANASISFAPDQDEVDIDNLKVFNQTTLSAGSFAKSTSTAPVKAVYNMTGTQVGTSLEEAPKGGVYIVLREDGTTTKEVK